MSDPLVSIFCFVRNRKEMMKSCIDSVLNQTYKNIEFVIQDGASTDGTVELIRSYADPCIKLVSAPDSGPEEAFWTVLRRCQGELIGSCLSDEEMARNAAEVAVNAFRQHPHLGAICRDLAITDIGQKVAYKMPGMVFDLKEYMMGSFTPHFAAAFFRRHALDEIGLHTRSWNMRCGEFELWCRLGLKFQIAYCAGIGAKYVSHDNQLSLNLENIAGMFHARAEVLGSIFSENPQLIPSAEAQLACKISNGIGFANYLAQSCGRQDLAEKLLEECKKVMSGKELLP